MLLGRLLFECVRAKERLCVMLLIFREALGLSCQTGI